MARPLMAFIAWVGVHACMMPAAAQAQGPCVEWTHAALRGSQANMAYDSARDRVVMVTGTNPTETWEWDGAAWQFRTIGGPGAGAMTYDSIRGVTVLFGGSYSNGNTWEWDGVSWSLRATDGPPPGSLHGMAFDSYRGVTVMFGGDVNQAQGGEVQDTWEWDGKVWAHRASTGPSSRCKGQLAFDPVRNVTVLFGGQTWAVSHTIAHGDTWEWDGATWTLRATSGAPARTSHAMAYDPSTQSVVVHGGTGYGTPYYLNDTRAWNGAAWSLRTSLGPPRRSHAMAFHQSTGKFVMFGGDNESTALQADTWLLEGTNWSQAIPTPMMTISASGAAMVFHKSQGVSVIAGGQDTSVPWFAYHNTTWQWDGQHWTGTPAVGYSPRHRHAMVFDEARNVMVMFGGIHTNSQGGMPICRGDTLVCDWAQWTVASTTGPAARGYPAMAYDSARERTVLFGGLSSSGSVNTYYGDTWEWDGVAWTQIPVTGPSDRYGHAMAFDPARGVTVLFGGTALVSGVATNLSDTWEWNGARWIQVATTGPAPRTMHQMVYDSHRGVTVMRGGIAGDTQTWEWSGVQWTLLPTPGFSGGGAMAFDSVRHATVVSLGNIQSTWELRADLTITAPPTDLSVIEGFAATFSVTTSGSTPMLFQWRKDGQPVPSGSGGTGSQLVIDPTSLTDEGEYDVVVTNDCGSVISAAATLDVRVLGDITGDDVVNVADLLAVIGQWGACPPLCPADVAPPPSGNGLVNVADLLLIISNWG